MPRVVSLFLPAWPTDRVRRREGGAELPADAPLVLAGREGNRRVLRAVDAAAHAAGLRAGMPVTRAQALLPGLVLRVHDAAEDAAALPGPGDPLG